MLRVVFLTSPKTTRWCTMSGESEPSLCNQRHKTTNLAKCLSSGNLPKLGSLRHACCSAVYDRLRDNVIRTLTHTVTDTVSIADVYFTLEYPMTGLKTGYYFVLSSFQSTSVGGTQVLYQLILPQILDLIDD